MGRAGADDCHDQKHADQNIERHQQRRTQHDEDDLPVIGAHSGRDRCLRQIATALADSLPDQRSAEAAWLWPNTPPHCSPRAIDRTRLAAPKYTRIRIAAPTRSAGGMDTGGLCQAIAPFACTRRAVAARHQA